MGRMAQQQNGRGGAREGSNGGQAIAPGEGTGPEEGAMLGGSATGRGSARSLHCGTDVPMDRPPVAVNLQLPQILEGRRK